MKIDELHDRLFELLCVIDDICREENVRWFLDGGTAIGAMREKDFIPWDDDMDIKVLAEDYPAFKAAMEKHLPPHMHLMEPDGFAPHFYDFVVRIYDDRFLLRRETPEDAFYNNLQNYLGTDVFIYFPAPADRFRQMLMVLQTKILYGMGMAHRYVVKDEKYTMMQKAQVAALRSMGGFFSVQQICNWFSRSMLKYQKRDTDMYYTGNYPLNQLFFFPQSWYDSTSYGEIRGRKFPVGENIDGELTAIYGDYMHPPKDPDAFIHHLDSEDGIEVQNTDY